MMTLRLSGIILFLAIFTLYGIDAAVDVDGGWSPWSVFSSPCNKPCGGGNMTQSRSCTSPTPQGNGLQCLKTDNVRDLLEDRTLDCNLQVCFNETWTEWNLCDNCTLGEKSRESMCGNETCEVGSSQYDVQFDKCNRWDIENCPSPCDDIECPEYGKCKDISTIEEPLTKCVCTMGYTMNSEGTTCIRPPPTTPTPRPIPTLPAAEKTVATVMTKSASVVLIVFVSITLVLFFILRIFTPDRVIQMNMEIALLTAHIFLMFPPSTTSLPLLCKIVSIIIHFCFTACFMFMMLEALHMYFLVASVVKMDGAFTRVQNTVIGWGISAIIIIFCVCFEYDNYGAKYHCWLQLDKPLVYGQFVPVIIIVIITFTLIEAAGAANYKPLKDFDEDQLQSAKISQRTNLIIVPFVLAHWIIGMFSEYEQNLPLYGTFAILNGVTGFLVFFFHCTNNQQVREKLASIKKKVKASMCPPPEEDPN